MRNAPALALGFVVVVATLAAGSPFRPPVVTPARAAAAELDPAELAGFVDQFMASNMPRFHAPGASVVVTKEGSVVFEKGYGYADLARRIPYTPQTRFRAKSVTKTFTATAVMQLVEAGRVDLKAPVTSYLPAFTLPDDNDPPITLDQLLTHSSGIGDQAIGTMTKDRAQAADLRGYLLTHTPPRIAAPGTVFSYTDHGISLAGLVVQESSGLPFAEYMQEGLLGPAGMARSAIDPPLEGSDLAVGYQSVGGSYRPAPVGYFYVAPAVGLVTTGEDMGRFLIGMLGGGRETARILSAETTRLIESRHFALQPGGPGEAYGLYEWPEIGERVLLHGGLGHGFSNLLVMLPERRVGLFVNTNSDESELRFALLRALMDRFYPAGSAAPKPIVDSDLGRFAGVHADYRYEGRLEALKELLGQGGITVNGDQTLTLSWAPGRWVEVEPLVFQNLDDPNQRIAFKADPDGHVTHVLGPLDDGNVKVPWYRSIFIFGAGTIAFAFLFLWALVVWPLFVVGRLRRRPGNRGPRWTFAAAGLAGTIGLLNVAFLVGVPLVLLPYADLNGTALDFGAPASLQLLFAIPVVTGSLGVPLATMAILAWRARVWGHAWTIHFASVAAAALLFAAFLNFWSLLGLNA